MEIEENCEGFSPEDPDVTQLLLEPNDHPIAKPYQEGIYREGLPVIVFEVEDIQKEYDRLKKLGVVFKKEPIKQDWGIDAKSNSERLDCLL